MVVKMQLSLTAEEFLSKLKQYLAVPVYKLVTMLTNFFSYISVVYNVRWYHSLDVFDLNLAPAVYSI
jgi:hypothetical protein